ncbi:phage tail tape measure protein [Chryseobacterium terrae]|uniref:Phage tail tape measure protein n=1 Tax=Chryseobacterium terrae TaxID=3163299 RepID=A0ABW8Y6R8_9FLAO
MAGRNVQSNVVIRINDREITNTFRGIGSEVNRLQRELRGTTVGSEEFIRTAQRLRTARERFREVSDEVNRLSGNINESTGFLSAFRNGILSFGDTFREVFTANLAERFFDAIITKGKATIEELLKIEDAMTDVEKTTGMTTVQVKELWDSFDEMDTRTSKLDRLKIAEVAGRLGVPIEQMKDFVKEVDKAYVALGDSFEGGLEGVVDQLGKIKGLFDATKELSYAEAINQIGSALNTLAAQGTASEGNISQFALRVGTLPDALKPAIDKVLGLGAAFEESGIDQQIAASGFSNFISTAGQNIEGFAISMRMSTKEAQELLNTKPEEFFLRFAQGMKGLSGTETAKVLESLKLNSLEVQKAVGAAANRTGEFQKAMKTANEEMDKATSLSDEFNKKNNNAPAILEKIKNAYNDIFTSSNVINKFEGLIKAIGWLTGVTSEAGDGIAVFKDRLTFVFKIIGVVIASIFSYNAAMAVLALVTKTATQQTILYNLVQKAKVAWETIARASVLLYAAAKAVFTGNTVRATAAMRAFNTTTKLNVIGLLVSVVAAAVVAYQLFSEEVDKATAKQKMLNDINKETEKGIISQKNELDLLLKTAKDDNLSKEQRSAAIKKLNELSPEYLGNLTLENIKTQEATNAVKAYTDALLRNSRIKVLSKKLVELQEKIIDEENKPMKDVAKEKGDWLDKIGLAPTEVKYLNTDRNKQLNIWKKKYGDEYAKAMMDTYGYIYNKRDETIKEIKDQSEEIAKEIIDLGKISEVNEIVVPTNIAVPGKEKKEKGANKDFGSNLKSANDAALKAEEEFLKAYQKLSEEKINIIEDEFQKATQTEMTRRNAELQNNNQEKKKIENEISDLKLQRDKNNKEFLAKEKPNQKDKEQYSTANTKITEAIATKEKMLEKGGVLDKIEEQQEATHQLNLRKIQEEGDVKLLQSFFEGQQNMLDEGIRVREEEIQKITSLEEAKLRLQNSLYLTLSETELDQIDTLEKAKAALREEANRKLFEAQLIAMDEQRKMLINQITALTDGPEKKKLLEDLENLKNKILEVKGAIKGGSDSDKTKEKEDLDAKLDKVDILGFSAKDWKDTFKNIEDLSDALTAAAMIFQAMGNAATMYADLQRALGERELKNFSRVQDAKKSELDKKLALGLISQENYNKQTELLDAELANKQAEIEYKQAKAEKISKLFSAIGGVAMGVANSLAVGGPIGIALAAIVGALGAVQIATIAAQPLPEKPSFAKGGFYEGYTGESSLPVDETGERPIGLVKLHRKEWVAPRWMTEHPQISKKINELEFMRANRITSFADGGFADKNTTTPVATNPQNSFSSSEIQYIAVMRDVQNLLQLLYDEGVFIADNDTNGRKMSNMTKRWNTLENKNKHGKRL